MKSGAEGVSGLPQEPVAVDRAPTGETGLEIVEMLDPDRIRVETVVGETVTETAFTSAARVYVR